MGPGGGRDPAQPQPLGRVPPNLVHITLRPSATPRYPSLAKNFRRFALRSTV